MILREKITNLNIYNQNVEQIWVKQDNGVVRKENTNKQIITTLSGLKRASNTYCMKTRSDVLIVNKIDKKLFYNNEKKDENQFFENKIIISKNHTRLFFVKNGDIQFCPGHISDLVHFGKKNDLLKYWNQLNFNQKKLTKNDCSTPPNKLTNIAAGITHDFTLPKYTRITNITIIIDINN